MKAVGNNEYDAEDAIGRGAFGTVYKGRNSTKSDEVVAIKEVDVQSYNLRSLPDAISRETEILNTLSRATHKNIVTLLDCEKQTHYVYFVMEFCNGGNLQEYLQSKQRLDESTIRFFLRHIAAGLRAAHDNHIIHRDLKPENILLCFSGPRYPSPDNIILKIADFGVGRFLSDEEMARTLCGSLLYMAPEVLLGRPYDYKVDLWCVGVMAYECFIGPLPKDSRIALNGVEIPTYISADFADLLTRLLDRDENNRFNIKQLFNHQFLAVTISVHVVASGKQKTIIHVKDNQSVDNLMGIVCDNYGTDSQAAYLIDKEGRHLERGNDNSIREFGIVHNNTFNLVLRLNGGNDNGGKVAPDSSSYVSR